MEQEKTINKNKMNEKHPTLKELEEDVEDLEEFDSETWGNQLPSKNNKEEWSNDWDNKREIVEFYNELKNYLLKK